MDIDILDLEKRLKENSRNSTEELLQYVLFEIQSPIEDYFLAVDILTDNYFKNRDIRLAILGAYLSSTWLCFGHLLPTDVHLTVPKTYFP